MDPVLRRRPCSNIYNMYNVNEHYEKQLLKERKIYHVYALYSGNRDQMNRPM